MIFKKTLETFIDITDPINIFSNNRDKMIMDKLSEKFVGVCYNSCLILKINKIIRRSYIYMTDTLEGHAQTNVMFEADAIEYKKDEIINGCKIIKKEPNGIVHAKSEYAGIQINMQSNMSIFKEGDVIPVIVKMVRYNVNQTAVSVLAVPFIPTTYETIYYKITGDLSKQDTINITSLFTQIKEEESNISKLASADKKIYEFFNSLLSNKPESQSGYSKIKMSNILTLTSGVVYMPNGKYDSSEVLHIDDTKQTEVISESPFIIYATILNKYLCNLQTLQSFIKQYPKFSDISLHKNIWKLYTSLKK
jgi:hypothetical protein